MEGYNFLPEEYQQPDIQQESVEGLKGLKGINPAFQRMREAGQSVFQTAGDVYNLPGVERSRFDKRATMPSQIATSEALNTLRSEEQSGFSKAFNATFGGAIGGLFTAIEDLAYIFDFEERFGKQNERCRL